MTAECVCCYEEGEYRIGTSEREVYDCSTEDCPVESFVVEVSEWGDVE